MSHLMQTYKPMPVAFVRGEGPYLEDAQGKRYFDALTGIAVCGLGHAHPRLAATIAAQSSALLHTSNLYEIPEQERLATRLCERSGMERVFFANSGAEANEAAIKIARITGNQRGIKRPTIIVLDDSFHGRTMATLTATGNRKVHAGFEPLLTGFVRAPFNDVEAIKLIAQNNPDVVAIMAEPVLGEGGIVIPNPGYLAQLRQICDDNHWFLMLDEVQTGNARTGRYFAYQHDNILPDVVTTAKGLGNGLPIGACLARGEAAVALQPGNHGSTFGGNPLACAVANAVLDEIDEQHLEQRAEQLGERIQTGLRDALRGNNAVLEVRGKGLMLAVELREACGHLVAQALEAGLLINVTQDSIVRLLPPLILTNDQADDLVTRVAALING